MKQHIIYDATTYQLDKKKYSYNYISFWNEMIFIWQNFCLSYIIIISRDQST